MYILALAIDCSSTALGSDLLCPPHFGTRTWPLRVCFAFCIISIQLSFILAAVQLELFSPPRAALSCLMISSRLHAHARSFTVALAIARHRYHHQQTLKSNRLSDVKSRMARKRLRCREAFDAAQGRRQGTALPTIASTWPGRSLTRSRWSSRQRSGDRSHNSRRELERRRSHRTRNQSGSVSQRSCSVSVHGLF